VRFLDRFKQYDAKAGLMGFVIGGIIADVWLTISFAMAVSRPEEHWPLLVPVIFFPFALAGMVAAAAAAGFGSGFFRPQRRK
jgi:hypothetical protein